MKMEVTGSTFEQNGARVRGSGMALPPDSSKVTDKRGLRRWIDPRNLHVRAGDYVQSVAHVARLILCAISCSLV